MVVGSGNMTKAGTTGGNIELGIRSKDRQAIRTVADKVNGWMRHGQQATPNDLTAANQMVQQEYKQYLNLPRLNPSELQVIPGEDSYYCNLVDLLNAASKKKGLPKAEALRRLTGTDGKESGKTPQRRLLFLKFLRLVEERDEAMFCTDTGTTVLKKGGDKAMANLLRQRIPGIDRVWKLFEEAGKAKLSYADVQEALSSSGGYGKAEDAVRWLWHLGVVEHSTKGHSFQFRLNARVAKKAMASI